MRKIDDASLRAWQHNSLLGSTTFAAKAMLRVLQSETATPAAKALAADINEQCRALALALKERIDQ